MIRSELGTGGKIQKFSFIRPSNFHAHLRREELMRAIAKHIMQHYFYLLVMPNTGPIRTMDEALAYYDELLAIAHAEGLYQLRLVMTLYLTEEITSRTIDRIARSAVVHAVKRYPETKGTTTGSGLGLPLDHPVTHYQADMMAEHGIPLLGHFEDVFDKNGVPLHPRDGEAHCVTNSLWRFRDRHPTLKICGEHGSTKEMLDFVKADTSGRTVMTITPHHALCSEEDFEKSWGAYLKCKPTPQTPDNRDAITEFMVSGDERAIAGDDTAAHLKSTKNVPFEKAAYGAFWTWHSITAYAAVFDRAKALDARFERFMSINGPQWWGFPAPAENDTITLVRDEEHDVPDPVPVPEKGDVVVPLGWTESDDRLRIGWRIAA